ncbi:MAG: radical SAM family heme chaperone HemW [Proteobacteria bacterium]|nr:radical SAM family heme chaperone HemW [Pseudomonadota bacterium]
MVASVYVHLPFCRGRCPYCDFTSNDAAEIPEAAYARALAAELRWRMSMPGGAGPFETVYLGGGTPSLLPAAWIAGILRALPVALGAEVTVEANPGDADAGWFEALVAAGATRFSIGVQATDGARLRWLGRRHGVDEAIRSLRLARESGARSVSADLIYGTPGHTPEGAAAEARALVELGAEHVSAYELTVSPRTPLGRRAAAGDLGLPGEEALVALWDAVGAALAGLGLERYEVSSYAKSGHRCRHNESYWRGGEYAGLGSGACGHARTAEGRLRYANTADVGEYVEAALARRFPADGGGIGQGAVSDPVDDAARARELVMLGLRWADGIDLDELDRLAGAERTAAFSSSLIHDGHARISGRRLVPTREGMLLADGLAERF